MDKIEQKPNAHDIYILKGRLKAHQRAEAKARRYEQQKERFLRELDLKVAKDFLIHL